MAVLPSTKKNEMGRQQVNFDAVNYAAVSALPSLLRRWLAEPEGAPPRAPCSEQRALPVRAGFWQGVPRRVLARHRLPGQSGPKRHATDLGVFMLPSIGLL
jgi:hypothetical protein